MNSHVDHLSEAAATRDVDTLSIGLCATVDQLAAAIGADEGQLTHPSDENDQLTQQRLVSLTRILTTIHPWAGSWESAWHWYWNTPIGALGGLSAATLVTRGESDHVEHYLAHLSDGGYA